eukprot:4653166-Prymnesium_polylepis.1
MQRTGSCCRACPAGPRWRVPPAEAARTRHARGGLRCGAAPCRTRPGAPRRHRRQLAAERGPRGPNGTRSAGGSAGPILPP